MKAREFQEMFSWQGAVVLPYVIEEAVQRVTA